MAQRIGAIENCNLLVAFANQMLDRFISAHPVIHRHHIELAFADISQRQNGHARIMNSSDMIGFIAVGGVNNNAVNLIGLETAERLHFICQHIVAGGKHHAITGIGQLLLYGARGKRDGRVHNIG